MVSQTYCPLPFRHMLVGYEDSIMPCCITDHRYADPTGRPYIMTKDSVIDAWNSAEIKQLRQQLIDGERPEICANCWSKEDQGLTSHRMKMLSMAGNPDSVLHDIDPDDPQPSDYPQSLTIRFGNICNLKCRICVPWVSSKWIEEWDHYTGGDWIDDRVREQAALGNTIGRDQVSNWPKTNDRFWREFEQLLPHMRDFMFSGGEPFVVPKMHELLRMCATSGHAAHIDLSFHTNGTELDDEILEEILPAFKSVIMQFSIDGIGSQFEYQRSGAGWASVDANLRRAVKVWNAPGGPRGHAAVNCTVSAMNVLYLHDYGRYFDSVGIVAGLNHLNGKPDLDPQHLPAAVRHHIANQLEQQNADQPIQNYQWGSSYGEIIAALRLPPAKESVEPFNTAIRQMDQYRGEDFAAVFPEMADLLGYRKHLD